MKLAIFGATGRVGSEILKRALADGHQVTALQRSPKLDKHPNLETVFGNVREGKDIERVITGADAVFSALGTDKTTTLTDALPFIIESMERHGIKRIITIGTAGILDSRLEDGKLRYQGGDSNRKMTFAAEEHEKAFRLLEQSNLEWTIVCPTYLPDGEAKGGYRVEKDFLPEGGKEISTGDTGEFAYRQLEESTFVRSRVGIAY
ncbi:NAD(P)-dependent oxidoreductase [Planomicrobium okeanokoites]|uniref:NAD(P)-dependent oxidoreductase n=1 Tax=Planomicrobium okeanokoites TaxID=244 RepID=A0ABV7KJ05_PLAOK|nr:SDR family oxidoreductase [Planomicrobium okeanokoites]TAA68843.1 SDR family oxidoreductase [Planomicrobium okeanokoites]